ncbi:MAG: hypothetical protein HY922_01300 [Elusimicrobia bacterium]|nr:hypothetical protein [Elusimicrobiota bacterium]
MQRAYPLLLLGALGMILSEGGVWNVQNLCAVASAHPGKALAGLLGAHVVYFCVFAIFADVIHRFKVRDFLGLLLLGSVYGLLEEGVLADKIFQPGLGPALFHVHLLNFGFTGLSLHPLGDFLGTFILFRALLQGRLGLADPDFKPGELRAWLIFCAAWLALAYAPWHMRFFLGPVPLVVQAGLLAWALVLSWLLLRLALARSGAQAPKELLPLKAYPLVGLPILLGLAGRVLTLLKQGRADSLLFYAAIVGFYAALFILHVRSIGAGSERSIYDEAFPPAQGLSAMKFLKIAAAAFAVLAVLRGAAALARLGPLLAALCALFAAACMFFAAAFPFYAAARLARARVKG